MVDPRSEVQVPEDRSRLMVLGHDGHRTDIIVALESIRKDMIVFIRNVSADEADNIIFGIADGFGLAEDLAFQASYVALIVTP